MLELQLLLALIAADAVIYCQVTPQCCLQLVAIGNGNEMEDKRLDISNIFAKLIHTYTYVWVACEILDYD